MKKKLAAGIFAAVFFTMFATVTVWAEKSTVLEQVIYDENNIKVSVSEAYWMQSRILSYRFILKIIRMKKWV